MTPDFSGAPCIGRPELFGLWRTSLCKPLPGRDNGHQDTTNASRPRTTGGCTPVQGLADRKDTTDS